MEDSDIEEPRSDDELELFPIEQIYNVEPVFDYKDPLLYSGIMKDVLLNDKKEVLTKISSGKSVRVIDNNGNSLLHLAVEAIMDHDMEMIDLLLQQDGLDINAPNFMNETPLMVSISQRKSSVALHLMKSGADVNYPTSSKPLHYCSRYGLPDVAEALIQAGANLNTHDLDGDTPLHLAVLCNQLEIVCMLLYYGADLMENGDRLTPFGLSINHENFCLADILLEYVTEFDSLTLNTAVKKGYPNLFRLVERIITDGGNFCFNIEMESWLILLENIEAFELIWNNFIVKYDLDYPLLEIFSCNFLAWGSIKKILNVMMKSVDRIMGKLNYTSGLTPYLFPMLVELTEKKPDLEFLQDFCTLLLSYGLEVWDIDLDIVFEVFGYCELFSLLLQMDIRFSGASKYTLFPHLIYSVDNTLDFNERLKNRFILITSSHFFTIDFDVSLKHSVLPSHICSSMKHTEMLKYLNFSWTVPKLVELARNRTRDYLCTRFKIKNSREFCTLLKKLYIPDIIKKIISFEIPIYRQRILSCAEISNIKDKRWTAMKNHVRQLRNRDTGCEFIRLLL